MVCADLPPKISRYILNPSQITETVVSWPSVIHFVVSVCDLRVE